MTIAAGIVCTDGILVCADTEHEQGDAKFQKGKVFSEDKDKLIVTGCSGAAEFIKIGYDKLADKVRFDLPANSSEARILVETVTSKLYKHTQFTSLWHVYVSYRFIVSSARQGFGSSLIFSLITAEKGSLVTAPTASKHPCVGSLTHVSGRSLGFRDDCQSLRRA